MKFEWDAENRKHIARHGITPEEAEEAVLIEPLEADVQHHESEERVLCFGAHKVRAAAHGAVHRTKRPGPDHNGLWDDRGAATALLRGEMSMPKKQIAIPKFRTEAEEAEWWDSHPEVATEIMKRAIKSGKARRAVPSKTVTMRLSVPDLKAAQDLAQHKGLPYQTYIKMLLHEALQRERRST